MDTLAQYAVAFALTTSAGIRGLLTLAVTSVAVHLGWIHPPQSFAWLGSNVVTGCLVLVALIEVVADKIPVVDHALHAVQTLIKPAAAAILVGGIMHPHSQPELFGLMALGALNALGVHAASASSRVASTAMTAGFGNPVLSVFEDVLSGGLMTVAFFAPLLAALLALGVIVLLAWIVRRALRRRRARAGPPLPSPPRGAPLA